MKARAAEAELRAYQESLAALLCALDEGACAEELCARCDAADRACDRVLLALDREGEPARASARPELAELLRLAAVASDVASRTHADSGARLERLRRARAKLAELDRAATGESCDVAG